VLTRSMFLYSRQYRDWLSNAGYAAAHNEVPAALDVTCRHHRTADRLRHPPWLGAEQDQKTDVTADGWAKWPEAIRGPTSARDAGLAGDRTEQLAPTGGEWLRLKIGDHPATSAQTTFPVDRSDV
jgi:hypothetical protein